MKKLVLFVPLALMTIPMFGQSISLVSNDPYAPPTGSVTTAAIIHSQYYPSWGYLNTTGSNLSAFSGNFQNGVTVNTGLQDQSLYMQNQLLDPYSKVYVPDTTWTTKSYPNWGMNPNCTQTTYYVACPPGQQWTVVTEPIPQQTSLDLTQWTYKGCYRTLANVQWTQSVKIGWYSYVYNYRTDSTSDWDGASCAGTITIQPIYPPSATY